MDDAEEQRYVEYVNSRLAWMRKVSYLLCQDWHRADDICQATLTRLYVHWRKASASANIDGYVRTILVRVFLGERRTAWASRVDLHGSMIDAVEHDVARLDHGAVWRSGTPNADTETRLAVQAALADVAPRQRAVLVVRYYLDLSVEESAALLGCSQGTVKSQTARGLEALRRALDARRITVEG